MAIFQVCAHACAHACVCAHANGYACAHAHALVTFYLNPLLRTKSVK